MRALDWVVLFAWLISWFPTASIGGVGATLSTSICFGKNMPWYAMGLSILATQASAITFISTTGQGYVDGHAVRAILFRPADRDGHSFGDSGSDFPSRKVYTAYEYLEQRFDAKNAGAGQRSYSSFSAALRRASVCMLLPWPSR